jgi:activator of HSP90 ATPase
MQKEIKKGVGSVWNQGSWHWEEKNYNKWAKDRLKALLEGTTVEDQGFRIEISKCISLEGEVRFFVIPRMRKTQKRHQ